MAVLAYWPGLAGAGPMAISICPSTMRTRCVASGRKAGAPSTRPSRTSNEAPCKGQTSRKPRSRPSLRRAYACVQTLASACTPSLVWHRTRSCPSMVHSCMLPAGRLSKASVDSQVSVTIDSRKPDAMRAVCGLPSKHASIRPLHGGNLNVKNHFCCTHDL